ncbi:MAG: histidine triad nucleotide-binding protein [Acidobacteriota bacterium]|nr:histidine triad nucleotide-binding protein [Blastocatellia bacterium]MDW8413095.1 histidine triad nucleotide-binding protein [Acidobacteriota bacterium]
MKCIFCSIAEKSIPAKVEYEDTEVVAFHDINPQAPTHILVIPRKHIASLRDISQAHVELMGKLLKISSELARKLGHEERGYRVVINTGPDAGQSVFHIHAHLLAGRSLGWPPG